MGVKSIVDRIEAIFAKACNFDVSGFAKAEIVTPELVHDLANLSDEDRKNLKKLGYEFKWFSVNMTDGLIFRWIIDKRNHIFYTQRLYFNGGNRHGRTGCEASSEEPGTH